MMLLRVVLFASFQGMQDHRRLRVWVKARELALNVRRVTQTFPTQTYSGLQSQMTDAAESVLFNIAEGCGALSDKEFARFLGISIKSSRELETQLDLAHAYGILPDTSLEERTIEVRKMTYSLRRRVLGH